MRILLLAASFCLFVQATFAQDSANSTDTKSVSAEAEEKPLDFWMQKKLDYSSSILKGLAMGDFDMIETNAKQMRVLNKIEGFARSRHAGYRGHVKLFERVTDEVIKQAKKENIEGVTLAYHQLTVSCVRCHQSIREQDEKPAAPADPPTKNR